MRNRFLAGLLVFMTCLWLHAHIRQEKPEKEKIRDANPHLSFIRMDLLQAEKKPLPPAKRSIFTAKRFEQPAIDTERLEAEIQRTEETRAVQRPPASEYLDLRYIGYVRSGTKIVALVIFRGEALAVMEGELIEEGITVKAIGLEDIAIIGPDSKPSVFSLEGELP